MNWDYSLYYAPLHPDTPEHWRMMDERMRRWLGPHLPADRTARVLDFGCGHGYALRTLQGLSFSRIEGLDADAGQVAYARAHGLPVAQVADSLAWLGARTGQFDLVLLLDVLEHVPRADQPGLLVALADSLRAGGRLILTVPNAAASLAGYWRYGDYTHHASFTPASLDFLLRQTGWTAPRCYEIELAPPGWGARALVQRALRAWRRLEFQAEFGRRQGRLVPVTPNLLAVAERA